MQEESSSIDMESNADFHLSKSDEHAISNRRSSRIRNAASSKIKVNKFSNLKNQLNSREEKKKIALKQSQIDELFDHSDEDLSLHATANENTVDKEIMNSAHNDIQKNKCTIVSSYDLSENRILQPEDVSKVLKILSKSNTVVPCLAEQSELKSAKPSLKTYCRQSISPSDSQTIESFGLPDNPIVYQNNLSSSTIDIESIDSSEITILDVKFAAEPWKFNIDGDRISTSLEEIRFKELPQKLIFESYSENAKGQEIEEKYVFTSTPRIKSCQGTKIHEPVVIHSVKSNKKKILSDKISEVESIETVVSSEGKNNLIHCNSLNHENEEVEISTSEPILKNEGILISSHNRGEEIADKEVDTIFSKKNHSIHGKTLLESLDLGLDSKLDEPVEVPRRVLRSKSSADISQDVFCSISSNKHTPRSLRKKWLSVSQDNVCDGMKNDRLKEKLLNKSFPQLKVVLSPIEKLLLMKDTFCSEAQKSTVNSTRKSLRSYKDTEKAEENLIPGGHPSNSSGLSRPIDSYEIIPIEATEMLSCSETTKKSATHPHIFYDNSLSCDNIDMNNITKENTETEDVPISCEIFQEFGNPTKLRTLKESEICLIKGEARTADILKGKKESSPKDKHFNLEQTEMNISSENSKTDESLLPGKNSSNGNIFDSVLNTKTQSEIQSINYSENLEKSHEGHPNKKFNDNVQSDDEHDHKKLPIGNVLQIVSISRMKKKRRNKKDIHVMENDLLNIGNSAVKYKKDLNSSKGINSSFHLKDQILNHNSMDIKSPYEKRNKHYNKNKLNVEYDESNCFPNSRKNGKSGEDEMKPLNLPAINNTAKNICGWSWQGEIHIKPSTIVGKTDISRRRKHGRKIKSHKTGSLNSESSEDYSLCSKEDIKIKKKTKEVTNIIDKSPTQFKSNNESSVTKRKRGRPRKKHHVSEKYATENYNNLLDNKILLLAENKASETQRKVGRPKKIKTENPVDNEILLLGNNDYVITNETTDVFCCGRLFQNKNVSDTRKTAADGEQLVSLAEVSFESALSSQNTIADLVKKRSRSHKNYNFSRSKSSGKKSSIEVHQKFETSTDISILSHDISTDSSINQRGTGSDKSKNKNINISGCRKNSSKMMIGKHLENSWAEKCYDKCDEIQYLLQNSNKDSDIVPQEIEVEEIYNKKEADAQKTYREQVHDQNMLVAFSNKIISNTGEIFKKKCVMYDEEKITQEKSDLRCKLANHLNNQDIEITKNTLAPEIRDVMPHYVIGLSTREPHSKDKESYRGSSDDVPIIQREFRDQNKSGQHSTRGKDRVQKEIVKMIDRTNKVIRNNTDDETPRQLKRMENDDDWKDVGAKSNLEIENHFYNECPKLLKITENIDDDEDIKDVKNKKNLYDLEKAVKSRISEKYEYNTETEDEMVSEGTTNDRRYKHILRSKNSLTDRMRNGVEDIEHKSRYKQSSYNQVPSDKDNMSKECKTGEILLRSSKILKLPHPEIVKDIRGHTLRFKVGSIAWAQIGSFPFWPCLVTEEPSTGIHVKNMLTSRALPRICYHVIFFGDKGRRAWISRHKMMVYKSKADLEEIYNMLRTKNKPYKELQLYIVRGRQLQKWLTAVEEADNVILQPLKERSSFFDIFTIANAAVTIKEEGSSSRKRLRSSKLHDSYDSDGLKSEELPVTKRLKKTDLPTVIEIVSETNEELNSREKRLKKLHKLSSRNQQKDREEVLELPNSIDESAAKKKHRISKWQTPKDALPSTSSYSPTEKRSTIKHLEKNHKISYNSFITVTDCPNKDTGILNKLEENLAPSVDKELVTVIDELPNSGEIENESGEQSEDKSAESLNLSTFFCESIEAQTALFKRNNLFKGVLKERVCQYCFLSGDILKCKGCNAVYHAGCAIRVLQELVIPRRRNRNSFPKDGSLTEENRIKVDDKDSKEHKGESDDEDHVQIITVPSSVYNTPPRKTFPPDFHNLTLAEQIDFKMKEIMKKFESKTPYAESPTDTSSEDGSNIQINKGRSFSRIQILFPPIAKKKRNNLDDFQTLLKPIEKDNSMEQTRSVEHVTAELSSEQTGPLHVTAESLCKLNKQSQELEMNFAKNIKSKIDKKQKCLAKHVTADCVSFDTLDSENSNSNFSHLTRQSEISETTDSSLKSINPKHFKCGFCTEEMDPYCFVCHQAVSKRGSSIRHKCSLYQCSRFYHSECLKLWPQTQWSLIQTTKHRYSQEEIDSFVCPQHVCHTCVSDDPRAATSRCSGDKIVKCQRCPSTYHSTSLCIPAGAEILSSTQIICPRHRDKSKIYTINTTWCFLCSEGGALICCETCPTSVHPECMPQVNLTEDEKFICEDCESGRLPLYDEIIWVKLGKYRWWPGLILFPNEIPSKVMNIKHNVGEFVVKFFGTYDHYWVNRGRSFLFQEGDTGDTKVTIKKKVEQATYKKAVDEAVVVHKIKKEFKLKMEGESLNSQKPPPYIKIKVNKPVGNVRSVELDLSNTTACECNPEKPNPCGPESDCLNRLLLTECNPEACPAGQNCQNQSFEKREYPPMIPYKTQGRGWGLKCLAPIKRGQFVIEYVGEIIDDEEYQRRIQKMHEQKEENYYFLTIDKDRMIDAGPKGNMARFMNHCCQPNCETQKWTVNGDTKVGLFATKDIPADTELTFNYNLECTGKEKKICRCGAPNCSGFIGVKAKQDTEVKKPKKTYKKKEPVKPLALPPCFICKRRGDVGACNNKMCNKAYHLKCLNITEWPEGNKFACPWHNCNTCSKRTIRCCVKCLNSFCPSHSEGNVRYDHLLGFVCNYHDPSKPGSEKLPVIKKPRIINDEMAVSSTTPDDFVHSDSSDDIPLLQRFKKRNDKSSSSSDSDEFDRNKLEAVLVRHRCRRKRKEKLNALESDDDNSVIANSATSISFKKMREENNHSQDETVSSATASDFEEEVLRKRKRRRYKKNPIVRKINKLGPMLNIPITANENDVNNVNSEISRHAIDKNRL